MEDPTDPIARLNFADRPRKEVQIVSTDLVEKMLLHALQNNLELLPFLVLGFFTGIRPSGELEKLLWSDIDLVGRVITIRPEVSKTNRRRFPELSENAVAWLEVYRQRGGFIKGAIVPFSSAVLRKKRRAIWRAVAGKARWLQQGTRHTFCTNWLAFHEDINKLVLRSGHDSVDSTWRSYHKRVKKADAEKFWAIMPPKSEPQKIIGFGVSAWLLENDQWARGDPSKLTLVKSDNLEADEQTRGPLADYRSKSQRTTRLTLLSRCCFRPVTRTSKNSSRFEATIQRNFKRSRSGLLGSCASSETR
jgi:hypothetical protein